MKWGEILAIRLAQRLRRIRLIAIPLALLVYGYFRYKLGGDISTSIFVAAIPLAFLGGSYLHAYGLVNSKERLDTLKEIEDKREAYSVAYGGILSELKRLVVIVILAVLWLKFK